MARIGNSRTAASGKRRAPLGLVLLAAMSMGATQASGLQATPAMQSSPTMVRVSIETDAGEIQLEIDVENAPVTALNFLHYVDEGLYDNGTFYRVVRADNQPDDDIRIEVVQAGMDRSRRDLAKPPIRLEGTSETGLRHLDGVISMARAGPDTGRAEFFICIGDQPELDEGGRRNPDGRGFAAFGRVIAGMDVVRAILHGPTEGQRLVRPIRIVRMERRSP